MIYINATCDLCQQAQAVFFEKESETFGDLLRVLRRAGWRTFGSDHKGMKLLCPDHKDLEEPNWCPWCSHQK